MSKKIKITIPSSDGNQDFFVGKKALSLALAAIVISPIVAGVTIFQRLEEQKSAQSSFSEFMEELSQKEQSIAGLNYEVNNLNSDLSILNGDLEQLRSNNHSLIQELESKNSQLFVLGKRINDVEKVLGISDEEPENNTDEHLAERVDAAAINSAVRATMFRLIPNESPLNYNRVSSSFGRRLNPISGKRHFHTGIDLTCKKGEPIYSPADGVIETVRPSKKGFGNFLVLKHSFGFSTSYAHLKAFKVKKGQFVSKGDVIAQCGNSGNSTGSHLHYETRFLGRYLNPRNLMNWTPENFDTLFEKEKKVKWAPLVKLIDNVVRLQINLTNHPLTDDSLNTASSTGEQESPTVQ